MRRESVRDISGLEERKTDWDIEDGDTDRKESERGGDGRTAERIRQIKVAAELMRADWTDSSSCRRRFGRESPDELKRGWGKEEKT